MMKPNNNRPKDNPNNFFARNIRDKGEDFLDHMDMTSDQLQIQAIMVFRDMVKGKIDIPKYARYFCDPRIISAFTIAANAKYQLYSISYNSLLAISVAPLPILPILNCLLLTVSILLSMFMYISKASLSVLVPPPALLPPIVLHPLAPNFFNSLSLSHIFLLSGSVVD